MYPFKMIGVCGNFIVSIYCLLSLRLRWPNYLHSTAAPIRIHCCVANLKSSENLATMHCQLISWQSFMERLVECQIIMERSESARIKIVPNAIYNWSQVRVLRNTFSISSGKYLKNGYESFRVNNGTEAK